MDGLKTAGGAAIPLEGVAIEGEVVSGHARVRVRQTYRNRETRPVEAVYTFPLPQDAALTDFTMTCGGRRLAAEVREREAAFAAYDDAVGAGHGAALLEEERRNVFTASVGNLLPDEETVVEVEYVQKLGGDEGALRWCIPTLVAPRYIPGRPAGDRTAHGWAEPTTRVPDADRITPPIGDAPYRLSLRLVFDLGRTVEIESPSHELRVEREGTRAIVSLAGADVALDRDVVVLARPAADAGRASEPLVAVTAYYQAEGSGQAAAEPGTFALTVVPDLLDGGGAPRRQELVFVIDTSGSMEGASIEEARNALRLGLRHLREGELFNMIAFSSSMRVFEAAPVPFTQRTLERADAWVASLRASGGTELREALVRAIEQAPDGVLMLLTDGQVGNEAEILEAALAARARTRVYSFGIGTNVSDLLLADLARRTGGAVEMIHPGERIDDKVVAQLARATAPRVDDVEVRFEGLDVAELAPSRPAALVDGEPWTLYGRLMTPRGRAHGRVEIRGTREGRPFRIEVPFDATDASAGAALVRMWAAERIRDLETADVRGRREARLKEKVVALAVKHRVSSSFTAFVVIEERTGERRAHGIPETRVVPVNVPAGWDMFGRVAQPRRAARPAVMQAAYAMAAPPAIMASAARPPSPGGPPAVEELAYSAAAFAEVAEMPRAPVRAAKQRAGDDAVVALLARQLASGHWPDGAADPKDVVARAEATAAALAELARLGITTAHAVHGAQLKKAVEALIADLPRIDAAVREALVAKVLPAVAGKRLRERLRPFVR